MKFELSDITVISADYGELQEDFHVRVQVIITEKASYASYHFNANVVGKERINKWIDQKVPIDNHGLFISYNYDSDNMRSIIEKLLKKINAKTTEQLKEGLSKFLIYVEG